MVFKRRDRRSIWQILQETVYPRGGWARAASYISHRVRRLPDPPARIARGNIKDLAAAEVSEFDALLVPGGFGAAKNLCNFAVAGADMTVQEDFLKLARAFHEAGKPIGLICIAPVMAAAICGEGSSCTVGNDADTAAAIEAMGGRHLVCPVSEARVDVERKLVTTPAYMLAGSVSEAYSGISQCVKEVLALA